MEDLRQMEANAHRCRVAGADVSLLELWAETLRAAIATYDAALAEGWLANAACAGETMEDFRHIDAEGAASTAEFGVASSL